MREILIQFRSTNVGYLPDMHGISAFKKFLFEVGDER